MHQLDILVPFGLPPAELARDITRALQTPSFAMLLAKSQRHEGPQDATANDGFSRALPHERWLVDAMGIDADAGSSPPMAPHAMRRHAMREDGWWFIVQPVHFHVGLDHLVLTDPAAIDLPDAIARQLFDAALPVFDAADLTLRYGDARHWYLRANAWGDLQTSTPDVASGRNIDIWMPKGDSSLAWRKLQNEVQMTWFAEGLIDRQLPSNGRPANSIWLWGGGKANAAERQAQHRVVYGTFNSLIDFLPAGDAVEIKSVSSSTADSISPAALLARPEQRGLLIIDDLRTAALHSDWAEWIAAMNAMETQWFAPLLGALRNGDVSSISIILSDSSQLKEWRCSRNALRKFWVKPTLDRLSA